MRAEACSNSEGVSDTSPADVDAAPLSVSLLPVEILIHVFEYAAISDIATCNALLLVSRALHSMLLPISYNARVLRTPDQLHTFEHYVSSSWSHYLVNQHITALGLILDEHPPGLWTQLLLERLTGLRHLAISGNIDLPVSDLTHLESLDILCRNDLWSLVSGEVRAYSALSSSLSNAFGSLTHLRVGQLTQPLGALIMEHGALPALTHFAFATIPPGSHVHAHAHLLHACKRILESPARDGMQMMVACGRIGERIVRSEISLTTITDRRFIVWGEDEDEDEMLGDWRVRALGRSLGFWEKAKCSIKA